MSLSQPFLRVHVYTILTALFHIPKAFARVRIQFMGEYIGVEFKAGGEGALRNRILCEKEAWSIRALCSHTRPWTSGY